MIRYLVVAAVLLLVAACGETTPTRWPTTTPASPSGSTTASEAEPTGVPNASSGDVATAVPADKPGDSASGDAATVVPADKPGDSASGDAATVVPADKTGEKSSGSDTEEEVVTTESGLQIKNLVVGTGEQAREGAIVVVHYTGWLVDGTKFDSSVDRGTPFEFRLGQGSVIKGWDEGVATMRVGGKSELTIPPELAYGDRDRGPVIKAGSTLVFEIELLEVKDP
ncbi:MAG: FKBP-type peptidyl-prolyl cis-trans isomerase [Chloroflexi bacterium]|nr:FKBP-type peptidyl-prolyl cis-trans isomerase [Chloroflexota bacterium]